MVARREKVERGMSFFFHSKARVQMTLDILVYLDSKGPNGVTFSELRKDQPQHRWEFIIDVLIPNGYARKAEKYRKKIGKNTEYYRKYVKYYITPEGEDFMLELENKYKEHKMKALYGRIL